MMSRLDHDICVVEARIARERQQIAALAKDSQEAARDAVASPRALLAVMTAGFALGVLLRPRGPRAEAARKNRLRRLFVGAAVALARARYGSPWSVVRGVASALPRRPVHRTGRLLARRDERSGSSAAPAS